MCARSVFGFVAGSARTTMARSGKKLTREQATKLGCSSCIIVRALGLSAQSGRRCANCASRRRRARWQCRTLPSSPSLLFPPSRKACLEVLPRRHTRAPLPPRRSTSRQDPPSPPSPRRLRTRRRRHHHVHDHHALLSSSSSSPSSLLLLSWWWRGRATSQDERTGSCDARRGQPSTFSKPSDWQPTQLGRVTCLVDRRRQRARRSRSSFRQSETNKHRMLAANWCARTLSGCVACLSHTSTSLSLALFVCVCFVALLAALWRTLRSRSVRRRGCALCRL